MSAPSSTSTSGVSFAGLLTIAFIVLKLTHVINWSWWLVLAPIWGSIALTVLIILGVLGYSLLTSRRGR